MRITRNVFVFFDVFYKLLLLSISIESLRGENRWKIHCQAERWRRNPFPFLRCLHQLCLEAVWVHMHLCLFLFQSMCMCCFHVFLSSTVCTNRCHHLFHLFINAHVHRPAWRKLEPVHVYRISSAFMHLQVTWFLGSRAPCIH